MKKNRNDMIPFFDTLIPKDGVTLTAIPGLRLFRISEPAERAPMSYEPQIVIIAQGRKVLYLDDETFVYDPMNYVVVTLPLPLECTVEILDGKPILGISIQVDPASVGQILLEDESLRRENVDVPRGVFSAPMEESMVDACIRLLQTLERERDVKILGPMIIREIIYRVLCGEHGWSLQALALQNRGFFQITRVLNHIQKSYDSKLNIHELAEKAGMSPTTFHTSFKHITGSSPLQYIKNVRLHKARMFMSSEGMNAYSAAYRVGYESPSHFSRDYKRLFGATPARDAVDLVAGN